MTQSLRFNYTIVGALIECDACDTSISVSSGVTIERLEAIRAKHDTECPQDITGNRGTIHTRADQ